MNRRFGMIRHRMAPSSRKYEKVAPWDPSLAPPVRNNPTDVATGGPPASAVVKVLAAVALASVAIMWVLR